MMLRRVVLVACVVLLCPRGAQAAQCRLSVTPVYFGSYNVFDPAPTDSTGTIAYRCNGGAKNVWITIDTGGAPTFARRMHRGSETLFYNLYLNPSRTIVWGNFSGGTLAWFDLDPPNNKEVELTVFGRVPPGQDVSAGTYTDSVTVTINY